MGAQTAALYAFNRGIVSPLALARVDVKRMALSAEQMENWMCRVMGGMMLRPGLGYIGSTYLNRANRDIPFVKATDDTAILEFTDLVMRIWVNDVVVSRVAVATTISNPTFATGPLTNWTGVDEAGGVSDYNAGDGLRLLGTGTASAGREQTVAIGGADIGVQHALRIVIKRGPCTLRVGSTSGGDQLISEATLGTGTHSLTFTPAASPVYVRFQSRLARYIYVTSCAIETAGAVTLPTPWTEANLGKIRGDAESQSADVLFLACDGFQQRKIERRSGNSWSVVLYAPEDGPFRLGNTGPITITPNALTGNVTLTANFPLWKSTQVGALWKLNSTGQTASKVMALLNDVTASIRVTGVGTNRNIMGVITGMTVGRTIVLERSFDNVNWVLTGTSYAADTTWPYNDTLDNQIVYYRLRLSVVGAAGNTNAMINIPTGTTIGYVRITEVQTNLLAGAEVLSPLGSLAATSDWAEGEWSDYRGWPTVGTFAESRAMWAGRNGIWASITDAFDGFDDQTVGASGPISRTIGAGPVDVVNFLVPLERIILGAQGKEIAISSSSLEEPLTPTNFNIKPVSTQGSSAVQALKVDDRAVYVDRGGNRVFEVAKADGYRYSSTDLTVLCPEVCKPYVVRSAVQRKPDTRLHFVLSDGTAAIAVQDRAENVLAWIKVVSGGAGGLIQDVCVLPAIAGQKDDQVYYTVARTIGGVTVRYREKWAQEDDCQGGQLSKQADAFVVGSGPITGLSHLEGQSVVLWVDGVCPENADGSVRTFTVTGGAIDYHPGVTWCAGLSYTAPYKSAKLGWVPASDGTGLTKSKLITELALVMRNVHARGLKFGQDFTNMDDLPRVEDGAIVDANSIRVSYDQQSFVFPGKWSTDSRLCLLAEAPRPVTALGAVIGMEIHR